MTPSTHQPRVDEPVQVVVVAAPEASGTPILADNPPAAKSSSPQHVPAPPQPALPEDRAAARKQEGVCAFAETRYGDARRAFEQAYGRAPLPAVLYNLAMADLLDGDLQSACLHFEQWKSQGSPDPARLAEAQKKFAQCSAGTP